MLFNPLQASKEHLAQLQAEQDESRSLRETIALLNDELRTALEAKSAASAQEEEHTIKSREMVGVFLVLGDIHSAV